MPDNDWQHLIHLIPEYDPVATAGLDDATWEQVCDDNYGDYWFSEKAADHVVGFFEECLYFTKGPRAKDPPDHFLLEDWQKAVVGNLFGWKGKDGYRRYRETLLMVARKNGKTPLASGICNYLEFTQNEPGAEIYGAAADTDGTTELWDAALAQRNAEPAMKQRSKVYKTTRCIERTDMSGRFRCVSSDDRRGHSYNTYAAVIDELHLHQDSKLVEAFETSTSARDEPLIIYLTTRDVGRESICNEKEDYAIGVREGRIDDPAFLPVLFLLTEDEEDRWQDEDVWKSANPNLGVSKKWSYMRRMIKKAEERPSRRNAILRLDLNIKTGGGSDWIDLGVWDECSDINPNDLDAAREWREQKRHDLLGEPSYGAIDLSANRDLTAFVLWFPEQRVVLPWFWIPEDTAVERENSEKLPYLTWEEYGFVNFCAGQTIDTDLIEERVKSAAAAYSVQGIAIDRWNSLSVVNELMDSLGEEQVVGFGQGYASMSYPMKQVETYIYDGKIKHGANPILRNNAGAVSVKHKRDEADNVKPDKDKSTSRIDGIVALIMAVGLAMQQPVEPEPQHSYIVVS